jgi:hypothetical protein
MFILPDSPSISPTSAVVKPRPPFDFGLTHHKEKTYTKLLFSIRFDMLVHKNVGLDQEKNLVMLFAILPNFSFSHEHGKFEDNGNLMKGFQKCEIVFLVGQMKIPLHMPCHGETICSKEPVRQ